MPEMVSYLQAITAVRKGAANGRTRLVEDAPGAKMSVNDDPATLDMR